MSSNAAALFVSERTALLFGGRGFIGSALTAVLVPRGFRVICVEPTATTLGRLTPWADHVELVRGSVADPQTTRELVASARPDCIVNLAFAAGGGIAEEMEVMARGTWNTLEAARLGGCTRVALASSVRVYGPQRVHGDDTWLNEESPCKPLLRYGVAKLLGEQLASDYRRKHDLEATALRLPMVYGPGVREGAYGVNVPVVAAATGEAAVLPYDIDARFCLAHVADVASTLADLVDDEVRPPQAAVYELGGHEANYRQMIEAAAHAAGSEPSVLFEPDGRGNEHDFAYRLDNSRVLGEYGVRHRSLVDGYRSVIEHLATSEGPAR